MVRGQPRKRLILELSKAIYTEGGLSGSRLHPLPDVDLQISDLGERDVMGHEVGHEGIVAAVMLQGLIDFRLQLDVPLDQFRESLLPEINFLHNPQVEVDSQFFKDVLHLGGIVRDLSRHIQIISLLESAEGSLVSMLHWEGQGDYPVSIGRQLEKGKGRGWQFEV